MVVRMNTRQSIRTKFGTAFLLIDGFSIISFASAVDPFRIANKLLGGSYFQYGCYSIDGNPVVSSSGLEIQVSGKLEDLTDADLVIVTASDGVERQGDLDIIGNCLRRLERHGALLGAICTGSYLLAKCNLLRGRACSIHWEYFDIARETFPSSSFLSQIFIEDSGLLTAAGGTAPVDLMIMLIAQEQGEILANAVRDIAIHHDKRQGTENQRMAVQSRLEVHDPNLVRCLELMDANIENPIDINTIASQMGLSVRQIQRLFRRYLGTSPNAYYSDMRLDNARYLIQHTTMNIGEVALATGFAGSTHFTRIYRRKFGVTPSESRKSLATAVKDHFKRNHNIQSRSGETAR